MEFGERIREELSDVLDAICQAGGGIVFEEFPGALEDDAHDAQPTAGGGSTVVSGALIEEANRLAETLELLRPANFPSRSLATPRLSIL